MVFILRVCATFLPIIDISCISLCQSFNTNSPLNAAYSFLNVLFDYRPITITYEHIEVLLSVGRTSSPPRNLAALAATQISSPSQLNFPFPGPYSLSELEHRLSEFRATIRHSLSGLQIRDGSGFGEGKRDDRCPDEREEKSYQSHMSKKPLAIGQESNVSLNGNHASYPSREPKLPPIVDTLRYTSRPTEHGMSRAGSVYGSSASPKGDQSESLLSDTEPKPTRSIRMHNILNPTGALEDPSHHRPPTQIESPQTSISETSWRPSDRSTQSPMSVSTSGSNLPGLRQPSPSGHGSLPRLTRNPSLNRGIPIGSIGQPNGTIDAKKSPFLSDRSHNYNPDNMTIHSNFPPNYPSSTGPRGSYGFSPGHLPTDRRGVETAPSAPASQSDSLSPYSSYSQLDRASPAPQYNHSTTHSSIASAHFAATRGVGPEGHQLTRGSEHPYGQGANAVGQSTYQLMTLDTDQGPIQVPVDVQAASKMADEKRKRNAGASARFRQRRKEKERESSQTISKLETQIRDIGEEKEYYRIERDYFRNLVYSTPAQAQVVPRMPSPRQRKISQSGHLGQVVSNQYSQPEERGNQAARNTRRRTSGYTPAGDIPQSSMPAPNPPPGFPPSPLPFPHPGIRGPPLLNRPPLPGVPPTRPGPFDPSAPPPWTNTESVRHH